MEGQSELRSLAGVSAAAMAAMSYARFASARVPAGLPRLAALLPVVCLLPLLPFAFASVHLRGISAFFLAWLSLFKLLLLSLGLGPLHPSLPLFPFLLSSSLPVKLRPSPNPNPNPKSSDLSDLSLLVLSSAVKAVILALIIPLYRFKPLMHPYLVLSLYCVHMYLALEIVLAGAAALARGALGMELEPQFDKPYLASSLRDFWGRRWNLMVSAVLRPAVYDPVRRRRGRAAGVLATFLVSGLMHEAMFSYLTLRPPTGEAAAFFLLHGLCTAAEGWWALRRGAPSPPRWVAAPATLGFVAGTGFWLFFPPILRGGSDEVVLAECAAAKRETLSTRRRGLPPFLFFSLFQQPHAACQLSPSAKSGCLTRLVKTNVTTRCNFY
ncbi:probable long-chain-alcohol O-fatty-acyltransferase 5 [Ananas comosus]|uniref:Probable long-chain-alcohol O-fatty-acyltransferase 5 n=1 Tax=Ananas comosus TaxID=4615 RepID=A0A6P5EN71_ANACO|nr:probable long-chain-alcohol O-fatty-acyltransferase 5 [Ananas comosus]